MIIIIIIIHFICIALFKELKDALHKKLKKNIKIIKTVTLRYDCRTNDMNPGLEDSWMNLGKMQNTSCVRKHKHTTERTRTHSKHTKRCAHINTRVWHTNTDVQW